MKLAQLKTRQHFDKIAADYDEEIPGHVREYLCEKKTTFILNAIKQYGNRAATKMTGLDCGCGTGWHVQKMRAFGINTFGIDISANMIKQAHKNTNDDDQALFQVGSALDLPFKNNALDFVYYINTLHHLTSPQAQRDALQEAHRVLKNNGLAIIVEMNADSPLVRLYINFIFPFTSRIDDDQTEHWLPAKSYFTLPDWLVMDIRKFTFIPNITPRIGFSFFKRLDQLLDKTTINAAGAHYQVVLKKKTISF